MRTIDALSHAAAEAIGEEEETLKRGRCGLLPACLRRQAYYLALHKEGRLRVANIALWVERPYRTLWGILHAAQDAYDVADPAFFAHYTPAQEAIAEWHRQNPDEADD